MSVLTISKLSKSFGPIKALQDVSFSVEPGEIFGYLGPNGAGKSTTLRCLMGYLYPTSGMVTILGKDAVKDSAVLKKQVSYVPAEPNLYASWSVDEHLKFADEMRPLDKAYVIDLKKRLSLEGNHKVQNLSTGNQQKLAIVLALASRPDLILLDEPTRGLDPLLRATFHQLLREYQATGGTALLSSHDLAEIEQLCTNVAIISSGKLVSDTSIDKLKKASRHKVRVSFEGSVPDIKQFKPDGLIQVGNTLEFSLQGDINELMQFISKHHIKDIEISVASLEDIFMELYV